MGSLYDSGSEYRSTETRDRSAREISSAAAASRSAAAADRYSFSRPLHSASFALSRRCYVAQLAREHAQLRGLPRSVVAHEADALTRLRVPRHALEHVLLAEAKLAVLQPASSRAQQHVCWCAPSLALRSRGARSVRSIRLAAMRRT